MNNVGTKRTMPEKCPQCGASLPAGALAGLCPACLLQQGAAADTATRPNAKPFVPPTVEEVARLFPQLEILGFLGQACAPFRFRECLHIADSVGSLYGGSLYAALGAPTAALDAVRNCLPSMALRTAPAQFRVTVDVESRNKFSAASRR